MLKIKVLESDRALVAAINRSLANEGNKSLRGAASKIKTAIAPIVSRALYTSPEIRSLQDGSLKADFGLTADPGPSIVSAVVSTLDVHIKKLTASSQGIKGGITVVIQPQNNSNLFGLGVGDQAISGGSLPWLEWLLTIGDAIVVANFGVEYGPYGRSGGGRMTKDAAPFKIDSRFSGTVNDNFITRSLDSVSSEIKKVIIRTL